MIQERLQALRDLMQKEGIDYYLIPTADYHNSEYVSDYFKVRQYFSGFTGSNGSLLVWQEGAGLWTDGRYFIQAELELAGSGITLFKMGEENVPTITAYLEQYMRTGMTLGFDGRVVTARDGRKLQEQLSHKQIRFSFEQDMSKGIWDDRPAFPHGNIHVLPISLTGKNTREKIQQVREQMQREQVEALFLTKLDDIMWLFNIRGCDVECNPLAMSYCYLAHDEAVLFLMPEALGDEEEAYFHENHVKVCDYRNVTEYLKELTGGKRVWLDTLYCNYTLYCLLESKMSILDKRNPTEGLKAVKNPVELSRMREIYLKDSVAVTKFIYWLKKNIGKERITEVSAADFLEQCRHNVPEFCGLSFPTIAGYNANGAMMHYEATPEKHAVLKP
ncbi:MAG: aminopeptidase P family N-terminal domain-containing protein, partial [Lachnospiraceae bacterium]|nr:aminopeptidase P family N-terminal domain-containing protein [Lachnospiraceae bacterium]